MTRAVAALVWLALAPAACGHAIFVPPSGPGAPTDASAAWTEATSSCRAVKTYSAALRISGRLAVDAAFTPDQVYMSATVSGQPIFLLAGSTSEATLWLRRDNRVVRAPAGEIIEAILELPMPPDRLLAIFSGCGTRSLDVKSASSYDKVIAVQTGDARVFLRRQPAGWRTLGVDADGFRVEFLWKTMSVPEKLWIRSAPGREPAVSLDVAVDDASITDPIQPAVFNPPGGAASASPMTLAELRSGAWRKAP